MALHWRPVGPEPASTYWQRRAVVATGLVLVLAVGSSLLTGGGDDPDELAQAPRPTPSATAASAAPTGSTSPTASPSPSPSAAVPICQPEDLKIEALTDAESYAVGATPRLTLRVTNTGAAPCTRDLGQAAVELVVFSGRDRIWSSDDCAPGGPKDVTTLEPGKAMSQRVTWNGRRSRPGCEGDKEQAEPGTYRVQGRVGQLREQGSVFRLTG